MANISLYPVHKLDRKQLTELLHYPARGNILNTHLHKIATALRSRSGKKGKKTTNKQTHFAPSCGAPRHRRLPHFTSILEVRIRKRFRELRQTHLHSSKFRSTKERNTKHLPRVWRYEYQQENTVAIKNQNRPLPKTLVRANQG